MKDFFAIILLTTVTIALSGCVGVSQTFEPPATTTISAPTNVATALASPPPSTLAPSPAPTITRQAVPTAEGGTTVKDPTLEKLIQDARADLSKRANVPDSAITVKSAEPVEWRDTSLGCPIEGMMYAQVITPGYLIVLEAAGKEWKYHASRTQVMYCDK
ncbi:MAG: hypothetical protein HY741_12095 [Chloroflexi bacterium]|nr:hypothetical protein [Chloroflexota bacterium]